MTQKKTHSFVVNPEISIVMSVYNGARYLSRSIESILSQEGPRLEFIIINDGSTDNSMQIIARYATQDDRIRIIDQENTGLTWALIRGCREARGKYIARHDCDDYSLPGRLAQQKKMLDSDQTLGFVSSWGEVIGPVADGLARNYPSEIRVVHLPKGGAGKAREAGRQLARGEFIQYLDSDDLLLPRKFEVQVAALRARPDCGAAYGYIRFCPADGPPHPEPFKWSGRELPTLFPWLLVDRWWNTDCPLFRRSVCDAVGPWADLRYSQDWEYDGRVGALQTRLVHCTEFVCEQRHHAELRQTGHGHWLEPPDRVRFFDSLFENALRAGVIIDSPEMKHFSRWVFSHARQCGAMGDAAAAKGCFAIAANAAGVEGAGFKMYRNVSNLIGWENAGILSCWVDMLRQGKAGKNTLKQSWMEQ